MGFPCFLIFNVFVIYRVKIVDDDISLASLVRHDSDEEELYFGTAEMKPVVANVIDDRPLHRQTGTESQKKSQSKWIKVGEDNEDYEYDPTKVKEESDDDQTLKHSTKTLSGKRAGLSNAKDIRKELAEQKRKTDRILANLSDEVSGKNARTVFRERGTGRVRDIESELAAKAAADEEQAKKDAKKKAVYDKWSKGLVQKKEEEAKIMDDLHEMSKPLARYGDDADLDQLLRNQERQDDPMLMAMRKKKEEDEKARNPKAKVYPKYRGPPPPPNRFNIMPGYRWDGVNRSNGYEAKIFAKVANKEASQEEAYRWSTQDM